MCIELKKSLTEWRSAATASPPAMFLVKGNGGKAFCAGGDVKSIWQAVTKARSEGQTVTNGEAVRFFSNEYSMNYLLGTSPVPQVSLWDGIVMGGGVGLSVLGDYRVATEKTLFAMPECAIGIFPDVGASWFLTHLPQWQPPTDQAPASPEAVGVPPGFDLYVGMTGARLGAADLVRAGIATHFVASDQLEELEQELEARCPPAGNLATRNAASRDIARAVLDAYHEKCRGRMPAPAAVAVHYDAIRSSFADKNSVEDIFAHLEHAGSSSSSGGSDWARETLALLRKQSPTSLKLTFEQLRRGRRLLSLRDCLRMEYRLMVNCIGGGSASRPYGDFVEGIRAVLVDKDNKPVWSPAAVGDVSAAAVQACFDALPEGEELDMGNF